MVSTMKLLNEVLARLEVYFELVRLEVYFFEMRFPETSKRN